MVPGTLNLTFTQGDDYSLRIEFLADKDDPDSGINYTGHTFHAQVRTDPRSREVEEFAVDATDVADGIIVLGLTAAQTRRVAQSSTWDLEKTDTDDLTLTLLAGAVTCRRDTTRES